MSAFWHWFVVILTLVFTAVMVWLFVATGRARVPSDTNAEGEETTGHVWDNDLAELNNPMPRWWLWLFYGSVIWSLIYLALYPGLGRFEGILGWTSEGQYETQMTQASEDFNERFGETGGPAAGRTGQPPGCAAHGAQPICPQLLDLSRLGCTRRPRLPEPD